MEVFVLGLNKNGNLTELIVHHANLLHISVVISLRVAGNRHSDDKIRVELEEFSEKQQILMQTSTGDVQSYLRYGKFNFTVDDQEAELTIYFNGHGFFLPFSDSLAGEKTYPAGRYLEPDLLPDGKFPIDFNLAYNPYCAYNELYSCLLPPRKNRLGVPIRAGEKIFEK